jgi:hypothetical protein
MRSNVAAHVLFGLFRHESATANDSDIAALNSSIDEIDPPIAPSRIDAGRRGLTAFGGRVQLRRGALEQRNEQTCELPASQ